MLGLPRLHPGITPGPLLRVITANCIGVTPRPGTLGGDSDGGNSSKRWRHEVSMPNLRGGNRGAEEACSWARAWWLPMGFNYLLNRPFR
jgi:hypothetical protein